MDALGRHILVELYGCSSDILNDVIQIEKSMVAAAKKVDATIINSTFHYFSPYGVSGVVVIQESHLAIHTWPEYEYAAIDLFTCGDSVNPWISYDYLFNDFRAKHGSSMEIRRGPLSLLNKIDFDLSKQRDIASKKLSTIKATRNIWFTERNENIALSLRHNGDPLFREQTPYQKVEIYDTCEYGKILTCDGKIMCAENDENVYHEMITHVPMFTHPNPKRVLVIGGGDGGAIRELFKHDQIEQVVMVEIDKSVIEASKKHLPKIASEFNNKKLDLHIEDGINYVELESDESFDIIIIDSTDPVGPAKGLFTEKFYRQVYRVLNKNGIMIAQSESPRFNVKIFREIYRCFRNVFGSQKVFCYLAYIPTYPSGMWSFSYCSKGSLHPVNSLNKKNAQRFNNKHQLKYYSDEIHCSAFVLPQFVKELLKE